MTEESSKSAEDYFQEGVAAGRLRDNRTALESYKKAVAMDPDHFKAQFNLGIRYSKIPMNVKSIECFREALRLRPEDAMVHYSMAVVSNFVGEVDDAFKHYKEAIRINPHFAKAHSNLAMVYYSLKKGKGTIHHLVTAADLFKEQGDQPMENNARGLILDCGLEFDLTPEDCKSL